VPAGAPLRDPATGGLLHSPFLNGIVAIMLVLFLLPGLAYGRVAGTVRGGRDLVEAMTKSMNTMGSYIVLVFFAAQFVAYFGWTRIGLVTAVAGAEALRDLGLGGVPLMLGFVLVSAAVNLVMGSASAKWALMAPIFVPMFMLLGYAPELTQAAYRVGDSVSNVLTPMMSFFALIVAFAQRYRPDLGLGTLIATMLPYSVAFLVGWMLLLVAWMLIGLPLGPGAGLYLEPAGG
jgi:aminobenzoyl-glutamate transport protein